MDDALLTTFEILLTIVAPLIVLYLRGNWPLRTTITCLLVIPLLWYLTYAPLHELSHVLAIYLVGGKVVAFKLIPRFWKGEFGVAWVTPVGLAHPWQNLVMLTAPYVLDLLAIVAGVILLQRRRIRSAFVVGVVFMLFCLRPAFDLVCETVSFATSFRGDLYHVQEIVGRMAIWSFIFVSLGLSLLSIRIVLSRYGQRPERSPTPSPSA